MSIKIAILDSGVKKDHVSFSQNQINGFSLHINNNKVELNPEFEDHIGHGTAIFYLINTQLKTADICAEIYNIKILNSYTHLNQEDFEKIMIYLYEHFKFDIINISMGFVQCGNIFGIQDICNKICKSGTIIVSAFNNDGAISFPAALDNVIGVDSQCIQGLDSDYICIKNSVVNIVGKQRNMRVAWINPDYIFVSGNSFVCANVTVLIAKQLSQKGSFDINILCNQTYSFDKKQDYHIPFEIKRAAIYPFNKEIHAMARFEDMLCFDVDGYYSSRISGQVGKKISDILPNCNNNTIIKDVENINLDEIDTLILGHNEMLSTLSKRNLAAVIASTAAKRGKNIYCFDPPKTYFDQTLLPDNLYYPRFTENFFTKRFGKLYKTDKPVLSVIGTNSKQGKFSLQLYLRKKFIELGYSVVQMGTEPTSLLFGFDAMFPCGYNGQIKLNIPQTITAVNELMWEITQKDYDIIITGGQSGFLAYNDLNARMFPSYSQIVFSALKPDAIILCISPYDDIDFIERTIKAAEGLSRGKVIGIVCFPIDAADGWEGRMGVKKRITLNRELKIKSQLSCRFNNGIGIYMLDKSSDIDELVLSIIDFFQ